MRAKRRKYLITRRAVKKAKTKAIANTVDSLSFNPALKRCGIFFTAAPAIIGMDKIKENLIDASLWSPAPKPAIIVIPDREVPGISASACAQPIKNTWRAFNAVYSFTRRLYFSKIIKTCLEKMPAETYYFNQKYDMNCALVMGGENQGISSLVKKNCDMLVKIPMSDNVNSLNVANAASILIYEIVRQRILKKID